MMTFEVCTVTTTHCEAFNPEGRGGGAGYSETSVFLLFLYTDTFMRLYYTYNV
jgi:hypothetical protein